MAQGKQIKYNLVFGLDESGQTLSEHGFPDEVAWVRQFWSEAVEDGFYLIEGNQDAPKRIWHGKENNRFSEFNLVYEEPA